MSRPEKVVAGQKTYKRSFMNTEKRKKNRCKGRTKDGRPCRAFATVGGLCYFHANPDKAVELGRIGGRNKRDAVGEVSSSVSLDNAASVRETVAGLIADALSNKRNPRSVSALAPLLNLLIRAIEVRDFEQRMARLEKLAESKAGTAAKKDGAPPPDSDDPDDPSKT
jgi:hypothetical protein